MQYTAEELAEILNGTIDGDPSVKVSSFSKIEQGRPGTISFLANPKYINYIYSSKSSIILVSNSFQASEPVSATLIRVQDPYIAFATLLEIYSKSLNKSSGISNTVAAGKNLRVGKNVFIGDYVSIGDNVTIGNDTHIFAGTTIDNNVTIGENCLIYSGVHIYHSCELGSGVTLHSGAVIGADGFGFAPQQAEEFKKVAQIGNVVIHDHVEIGANTTVDRATLGSTIIHKGVKLDNLIQVAHNVEIGENTVIASQTGISGSSRIGANCMIGGQVGIAGHLTIGNNVKIAAQAGIGSNIKDNEIIMGSPAFKASDYKKAYVFFRKLPQLVKRLETIEKKENQR